MVLKEYHNLAEELHRLRVEIKEAERTGKDFKFYQKLVEDFDSVYAQLLSGASDHARKNAKGVDKKEINVWAVHPLSDRILGIMKNDARVRYLLAYLRSEDVNGILVSDAEYYVRGEHLMIDKGACGEVIFTYDKMGIPLLPLEKSFLEEGCTLLDIAEHHFVGGCYANRCVRQFSEELMARSGKVPNLVDNWIIPFYLD